MLGALRANLEAEQRIWHSADTTFFTQLLTTWQAAWVSVASFPYHCDVLGVLNALHESGPTASETALAAASGV